MKKIFACLALLVVVLISCQREINFDPTETPPPPPLVTTNDSVLLSELIYLDTAAGLPDDTARIHLFLYDSQKRISEIKRYYYFSVPGGDIYEVLNYSYNGTDTLPYKIVQLHYGGPTSATPPDTFTHFINYNAQGLVIYDSTRRVMEAGGGLPMSIMISDIRVAGPNKYRNYFQHYYPSPPSGVSYYHHYDLTFSGSNIIFQTDTSTDMSPDHQTTITYDNKVNPLYAAFRQPYPYYYNEFAPQDFNTVSRNNFTSFKLKRYNSSIDRDWSLKYQYQYNANGYPVSAIITDELGTYSEGNKIIYRYTNH